MKSNDHKPSKPDKLAPVVSLVPDVSDVGNPGLAVGDSIYYRHPEHGAATHGVVAAIGKHGVTTDADGGGEHKVRWEHFLGHRRRVERKLTIIDRGEDGSLMRDEHGKVIFVRGNIGDVPETAQEREKALPPAKDPGGELEKSLLIKAQVVRELSEAGFEPMMDYVSETFGDNFVYRPPVVPEPVAVVDTAGPFNEALQRLTDAMGAQFQGLAAAISMLAERVSASENIQNVLLAALAEARKPADAPAQKARAVRGIRNPDGTITITEVDVPRTVRSIRMADGSVTMTQVEAENAK